MKRIRLPKFRHLKKMMLFWNSIILSVIIGLTAIIIYTIAVRIQLDDAIRYNTIMVTQISKSIDNMVESFNRVMDEVTFDEEIQSLLQTNYSDEKEMHVLNKYISSNVVDETLMFDEVDLIYLYDTRDARVNLRRSVNDHSYDYFNNLHPTNYNMSGKVTWNMEQSLITANRVIYDIHSYKMKAIGYLTMSMKKSYLQERVQKFDPSEQRHIIIVDNKNNVILSNSKDKGMDEVSTWLSNLDYHSLKSDSFIDVPIYGKMIVSVNQSELTDWKIISLINLNEITKGPALIQKTIFLIGLVGILFGIIIIWILTNYIVKPLNKLSVVMDEVERDNFNVQVELDREDELGRVGESFNRMMNKINTLISDIYQKDINEKDAQLRALRAQINPHFLYNTLDAINWMAQFGKTDEVSKMTIALSRLLKSSIQNKREFITLEEEMKYIEDYMTIQKIRFQDKVTYEIHISSNVKRCLVPKLILQPIVENAMIHGIEKKIENGYLFINGTIKDNKLLIQVIDNGIGMSEETVNSLLNGSYENSDHLKGTGNGILNVQNRIRLLYGEGNGVKIESNIHVGTLFELSLPIHREGYKNVQSTDH